MRLPNPPSDYSIYWANQYTRILEDTVLQLQNALMNVVLPSYTTDQKNALINQRGLMIFDTTLGKACINTGSGWETITSS